jgi:deoxyribonuclease-4
MARTSKSSGADDGSPLIGAHVSIAGSIANAPLNARREGLETFQCFTRSPQGGPAPELTAEVIGQFRKNMETAGLRRFVVHAPYYINLASPHARIRHASRRIIREELERSSLLGASFVMFHPGSHAGRSLEEGLASARKGMGEILDGYAGTAKLLVEISAGAGQVLGDTFEEVAAIIRPVLGHPGFGGVCFDTCHAYASGYDFRTPADAQRMLDAFDRQIGLELLRVSHVQDSKTDLNGRRDRHEHIGKGFIGVDGLKALLATAPFRGIDWILETETDGRDEDVRMLRSLRDLLA